MSRVHMILCTLTSTLMLSGGTACRRELSDRELTERGFHWSPSEEPVAWLSPNQLIVLWKDEWRSGPDAVWIRCARTGIYEIDSAGHRAKILTGQDMCDATARASDFEFNSARQMLVFADTTQVYRLDLASRSRISIAPPELRFTGFPSLSPDGERLAFFGAESSGDSVGGRRGLYLAGPTAATPRLLFPLRRPNMASNASWAPDRSRLAVSVYSSSPPYEDGAQILILDTTGQLVRALASGRQPAWSPTGDWIAYLSVSQRLQADSTRARLTSLRAIRPDGTDERLVFSPNDSAVFGAFTEKTVAGSPSGRIVWSRDGRSLAFSRIDNGRLTLWTINLDGTQLRELTAHPDNH